MMRAAAMACAMTLGAVLAACSPQPAAEATPAAAAAAASQPAVHPVSGLKVMPLTVTSAKGAHRFMVELADTGAAQQKGLMFRTAMGPDEGMIFPSNIPQQRSFWMKNTVIPLDIIFIGADHRILNILQGEPYSTAPLPSAGPAINVLELNAGRSAELGIAPGDMVSW